VPTAEVTVSGEGSVGNTMVVLSPILPKLANCSKSPAAFPAISWNKRPFSYFFTSAGRAVYSAIAKTSISFTVKVNAPVKKYSKAISLAYMGLFS
jgi:hypothetical protein